MAGRRGSSCCGGWPGPVRDPTTPRSVSEYTPTLAATTSSRATVADLPQSPPARAPALYFVGTLPDADGGKPFNFRLPCPPTWHDRAPSAWAADRRARRAYFATLDALRSGRVDEEEVAKSQRLLADIRSMSARAALTHFLRIMDTVRE